MRPSNTEPILRVYAEAATEEGARDLTERFKEELRTLIESHDS
jgi:phosphomannomutase